STAITRNAGRPASSHQGSGITERTSAATTVSSIRPRGSPLLVRLIPRPPVAAASERRPAWMSQWRQRSVPWVTLVPPCFPSRRQAVREPAEEAPVVAAARDCRPSTRRPTLERVRPDVPGGTTPESPRDRRLCVQGAPLALGREAERRPDGPPRCGPPDIPQGTPHPARR